MLNKLLRENPFVILDGGMGTQLQANGLRTGECPELFSITHPEIVRKIHRSYIDAGSMIVYSNTFGANRYKLAECGYSVREVVEASIRVAKSAVENTNCLVALDIGPIGQLMEPTGSLSFDEAYDIYKEVILAGKNADLIVFETMTDLSELKAGILSAKENSDKPVICTMTFEENQRTFTGCSVSAMALTMQGLGVDALGVNCSLGPEQLKDVVSELSHWTTLPIIVKPNAGLPDPATGKYDLLPQDFAVSMVNHIVPTGAVILGGCCGTTPEYIRMLCQALVGVKPVKISTQIPSAVCSSSRTVLINQPRIIGERINPTGKKLFKEALRNNNLDYILSQGIEQVHAGADILDVNVGLPEIDEEKMMVRTIKGLQGVVDVPLQIDSTIPKVLESALRVYSGKPIVNSVNGEEKSLESVLPLVKKYGASVVGLTLDKDGIPKTAEGRFAIAKKIVQRANVLGISNDDIYIDCLTLTASAEQEGVMETLNALERVKNELGVKTVLGVSNISFGLPNRELVTSTFLTMALQKGLDLPIINPNVASMVGAVRAYKLLANIDKNSVEFIQAYNNTSTPKTPSTQNHQNISLDYAIENGLKKEGAEITEKLLETLSPMDIINNYLIPTLDKTGVAFEKGKIFLPQLIQSASVSQACFEVIKKKLISENNNPVSKGKIVLATVKGDVHDIGKNIVKVLLENYGYTVIDLGKDVDYEEVVKATVENNVRLVGLSALMTTTLKSMEETIKLLRKHCDCKVMVGGAVLTPEYAKQIGADFYSKDAKESVDIAKKVLG